ncbi:unnamed protein product [Protopolystoma xenopodis]|uniref:Uncharacterized protein n=1 Tax=Protopolystoma xenopodis TaxID=117903 RepID=A0A3S5CHM6_9PLAT|nr:unnamed protein product [Protopolystoma xenopodis]
MFTVTCYHLFDILQALEQLHLELELTNTRLNIATGKPITFNSDAISGASLLFPLTNLVISQRLDRRKPIASIPLSTSNSSLPTVNGGLGHTSNGIPCIQANPSSSLTNLSIRHDTTGAVDIASVLREDDLESVLKKLEREADKVTDWQLKEPFNIPLYVNGGEHYQTPSCLSRMAVSLDDMSIGEVRKRIKSEGLQREQEQCRLGVTSNLQRDPDEGESSIHSG